MRHKKRNPKKLSNEDIKKIAQEVFIALSDEFITLRLNLSNDLTDVQYAIKGYIDGTRIY